MLNGKAGTQLKLIMVIKLYTRSNLSKVWVVCATKSLISSYVVARIPEIRAFNNIALRLKSGLRSSLNVGLR